MDTGNEKWIHQIRSLIFSPRAMWRLIGASLILHFIGLIFGVIFNIGIFIIIVTIFFGILWFYPYWQPAYSTIYWIVGDKNLPSLLEPHTLKWWDYLLLVIKIAVLAYILYIGLNLVFK